jgi:hypothetical protein
MDIPLVDDTGSVIRTARGLLYDNRYRTANVTNQLLCSCNSPIYTVEAGTNIATFSTNSTYLFTTAGRLINGFRYSADVGKTGTTSRSAAMGGFITFTTLEYRICVRSVTFYFDPVVIGNTSVVFGVYGTNDNLNFKRLSVIDLNLPKTLKAGSGSTYLDNQGDIQGYVNNTTPFAVETNTGVTSVFYGAPNKLSADTRPEFDPRTFTFKNDTCYSTYMLKHLPQNTANLTSDSLDTFTFSVSEIEWG